MLSIRRTSLFLLFLQLLKGLELVTGHIGHCTETRVIDATLTKIRGFISNGKDDHNLYFNNERCSWLIKIPPGYQLVFQFVSIDLEQSADKLCRYDSVAIFESSQIDESKLITRRCGPTDTLNRRFTTSGNATTEALVYFRTDGSGQRKGFELKWQIMEFGLNPDELTQPSDAEDESPGGNEDDDDDWLNPATEVDYSAPRWAASQMTSPPPSTIVISVPTKQLQLEQQQTAAAAAVGQTASSSYSSSTTKPSGDACSWSNSCFLLIFGIGSLLLSTALGVSVGYLAKKRKKAQRLSLMTTSVSTGSTLNLKTVTSDPTSPTYGGEETGMLLGPNGGVNFINRPSPNSTFNYSR